jgi:hypothetical protein
MAAWLEALIRVQEALPSNPDRQTGWGMRCIFPVATGKCFLAIDPEARVRFPALLEKKVVGLERGPLSLVSTTEELLDRKVAAPV